MIAHQPIRVLFNLGPFQVYAWGLMFVIAFLVALFLTLREAKKQRIDSKHIYNIALIILAAGLVGSRLFHIFENLSFYASRPAEVFAFSHGGLTSYGAFLSLLFVWLYVKRQRLHMSSILDLLIPYVALALAIMRIGCFLNWCCYGKESSLPWAVSVDGIARHPTQLYHAATNLTIFFILIRLKRAREIKEKPTKARLGALELIHKPTRLERPGFLFFCFLLFYAAFRFFVDFLREYASYWAGLALSQWICIALFAFSALMIKRLPMHAARAQT